MIDYFDTSAFATLAFEDHGHRAIDRWMRIADPDLAYSAWMSGEFSVAVSRRVRATGLADGLGHALLARADAYLQSWRKIDVEPEDVETAARWVRDMTLALSLPDALHIALAQRNGARLITTDRQQFAAAIRLGVTCFDPVRTPLEAPR